MGLLVINEAFDVWADRKTLTGYHAFFNEWAERDLTALIRRDRNHPCVIMWCIGNEVVEQNKPHGAEIARQLTAITHRLDSTRPTTAGFSHGDAAIANGLAAQVDVPGWNYHPAQYERFRREHPTWPMYGSETVSCVSSRGEYYFPVVKGFAKESSTPWRRSFHCSSYDLDWRGCIPDIELAAQEDNPTIFGEFVWTGFDYLGEPTPYREVWPSRSSYYGIVDLAGLPKDRYYLYKSILSAEPVLHILPHWNWPGMEGQTIPVHCYTSCQAAELFLNGRSLGICRKDKSQEIGRFRLIWDVPYEPGVLRVIALDDGGRHVAEAERRTAGPADHIHLALDRQTLATDGEDLLFVTATVCDKDGTICPRASDRLNFFIDGQAQVIATCNGDQTCLEPFQNPHKKAFNGCCVAIIRAPRGANATTATLRVEAETLRPAQSEITLHPN